MSKVIYVSVIIPTFDRASTVARAIDSVLDQAASGDELVVVDDGSADDTHNVLARYEDPRLVVERQENRGRCAARNRGAALATREWLIFLDSDDELRAGALDALRTAARDADLVVAPSERISPAGAVGRAEVQWDDERQLPWGLQAGAFAVRKSIFDRIGGYCAELRFAEHTEMAFRLRGLIVPERVARLADRTALIHERDAPYDPSLQYATAMHLLRHLATEMADDRNARGVYLGIAGEAASRLGRRSEATRLLSRSLVTRPRLRTAARLGRALIRPPAREEAA